MWQCCKRELFRTHQYSRINQNEDEDVIRTPIRNDQTYISGLAICISSVFILFIIWILSAHVNSESNILPSKDDSVVYSPKIWMIKIYGERNSGTNAIRLLLEQNLPTKENPDLRILGDNFYLAGGWKHGFFTKEAYEKFNIDPNEVLFVCVIREFKSWLKSMFNNPYSIRAKGNMTFSHFLNDHLQIEEKAKGHPAKLDPRERHKTIMQIRHEKFLNYKEICSKYNCILMSLEWFQNNGEKFLDLLAEKFGIYRQSEYKSLDYNVKHEQNLDNPSGIYRQSEKASAKNREYGEEIPEDFIAKVMENKVEQEIMKVTVEGHLSSFFSQVKSG